jgi:hypothetical protein
MTSPFAWAGCGAAGSNRGTAGSTSEGSDSNDGVAGSDSGVTGSNVCTVDSVCGVDSVAGTAGLSGGAVASAVMFLGVQMHVETMVDSGGAVGYVESITPGTGMEDGHSRRTCVRRASRSTASAMSRPSIFRR